MKRRSLRPAFFALAAAAILLLGVSSARAHFILQAPACWMSQDSVGAPEKLGPCGDEGGGTATSTVTAFQSGQTITVTINEVIFHPGHYRIALAVNDRSELPPEPPVTAGSTPCGSVPVQNPPVFPVLADGVFDHAAPFNGPQSVQITLPSNVTCSKCTLQIIEFMSNHGLNNPGGCFYHHCADISIQTTPVDGSGGTPVDASASAPPPSSKGGCAVAGSDASPIGLTGLLLVAAVTLARRRLRYGTQTCAEQRSFGGQGSNGPQ